MSAIVVDPDDHTDVVTLPRIERHNIGTPEAYDDAAASYASSGLTRIAEFCRERAASLRGIPWVPVNPCS